MAKTFDADQDYDAFESWFQDLSDEQFGKMSCDFLLRVKPGTTFTRDGYDMFKGWSFEHRWPEVRMRREAEELRAQGERWAA